jgi:hypothetical protein
MAHPHTFHRPWAWAVAGGLIGAVVAAGVLAPALWLAQAVDAASQGRLQLQQC